MLKRVDVKKIVITCFVGLLILSILSSVPLTGSNEDFAPTPVVGPTLLPESEMPSAFITCGELPEFKDKQAEQEWLKKLTKLGDRLDGDDVPFWYPDGPVVSHGAGADGYYYVGIKEDLVWKLKDTMVAEIVAAINKAGRELGFEREVPVKFDLFGESVDDKARDEEWRPVIGGIQVQNIDLGYRITSTLGWAAKHGSTKGFVVSGHIGHNRPIQVDTTIYQPTRNPPKPTGEVSSVGGVYADVAWVPFSNVAPQVYVSGIGFYIHWYQDPSVGSTVHMSGITSDVVTGTVIFVNRDVPSPTFGTLYDQALADYPRASGDSGAPVWLAVSGWGRGIVGIHSGANRISGVWYARFSPTSGVNEDVGVVPLTMWD